MITMNKRNLVLGAILIFSSSAFAQLWGSNPGARPSAEAPPTGQSGGPVVFGPSATRVQPGTAPARPTPGQSGRQRPPAGQHAPGQPAPGNPVQAKPSQPGRVAVRPGAPPPDRPVCTSKRVLGLDLISRALGLGDRKLQKIWKWNSAQKRSESISFSSSEFLHLDTAIDHKSVGRIKISLPAQVCVQGSVVTFYMSKALTDGYGDHEIGSVEARLTATNDGHALLKFVSTGSTPEFANANGTYQMATK
ncbi:MAG: hypothetical protein AB7F86_06310 [Bdellovibrionales bacterium]